MSESNIELSADVSEFFGRAVTDAIHAHGYDATDAAAAYVVALLADYTRPGQLGEETLTRPLTLLLEEALQTAGQERFERLRSLGDGVLYVSGFFSEHLETRGVEPTYISALGSRAYGSAAAMLRHGSIDTGAPDLFRELADKFRMFVDLLGDVADALHARSARSDSATVKLYERWLKTGSTSIADELTARGLYPLRGSGSIQ